MKRVIAIALLVAAAASAQPSPTPKAHTAAAIPTYKELKYPALKPIKIPDVATFTLPNGIKLYLLENHELPLVRGSALVRTGNLFDPADRDGARRHNRHGDAQRRHAGQDRRSTRRAVGEYRGVSGSLHRRELRTSVVLLLKGEHRRSPRHLSRRSDGPGFPARQARSGQDGNTRWYLAAQR